MGTDLEQEEEERKRNKSNSKTDNRSQKTLHYKSESTEQRWKKKFTTPTMIHKLSISHVLLIKT